MAGGHWQRGLSVLPRSICTACGVGRWGIALRLLVINLTIPHDEPLPFEQTSRGLAIDLPEEKPCEYVQCYAIALD
jgi:hypothetical protein